MKSFVTTVALVLSTMAAQVQACDAVAKARAIAVLDLQSSDAFISNDGPLPLIRNVWFLGATSPEKPHDYHVSVSFGTEEMKKNWELKHAVYIISVNPDSCSVQNITLLGIGGR